MPVFQLNRLAVVFFNFLGFNAFSNDIGGGVVVAAESQGGGFPGHIGRDFYIDVIVFGQFCFKTELLDFGIQFFSGFNLFGSNGYGVVALAVVGSIGHKPVQHSGAVFGGQLGILLANVFPGGRFDKGSFVRSGRKSGRSICLAGKRGAKHKYG